VFDAHHHITIMTNFSTAQPWRLVLLLSLLLESSQALCTEFQPVYTGIPKEITWTLTKSPVSLQSEKSLLRSGVLIQRGEFGRLSEFRLKEIEQVCQGLEMTLEEGISLRRQEMVTRIVQSTWKLSKNQGKLSRQLSEGRSIADLSHGLDQPPVSILRTILDYRIGATLPSVEKSDGKLIVKAIVAGELTGPHLKNFLSSKEQHQLDIAKDTDLVGYSPPHDESQRQLAADLWEHKLHRYLDDQGVDYYTENELREGGLSSTPDCLIRDDCTINGKSVRWIDSKNFYGSGSAKVFRNKAQKQIQRYERVFEGAGAIVYRHGFCSSLSVGLPDTLLLDSGPLALPEDALNI